MITLLLLLQYFLRNPSRSSGSDGKPEHYNWCRQDLGRTGLCGQQLLQKLRLTLCVLPHGEGVEPLTTIRIGLSNRKKQVSHLTVVS